MVLGGLESTRAVLVGSASLPCAPPPPPPASVVLHENVRYDAIQALKKNY